MGSISTREPLKQEVVNTILTIDGIEDFHINESHFGYACWRGKYQVMYFLDNGILFSDAVGIPRTFFMEYTTMASRAIGYYKTVENVFNFLNVN